MKEHHPISRRLKWHPLVVVIPFGYLVYSSYTNGLSILKTVGLVIVGIWFLMSVCDIATNHKLLDWMYGSDEDDD